MNISDYLIQTICIKLCHLSICLGQNRFAFNVFGALFGSFFNVFGKKIQPAVQLSKKLSVSIELRLYIQL